MTAMLAQMGWMFEFDQFIQNYFQDPVALPAKDSCRALRATSNVCICEKWNTPHPATDSGRPAKWKVLHMALLRVSACNVALSPQASAHCRLRD